MSKSEPCKYLCAHPDERPPVKPNSLSNQWLKRANCSPEFWLSIASEAKLISLKTRNVSIARGLEGSSQGFAVSPLRLFVVA